jgi:NADH-quinone oxidoreductase subunit L
MFLLIGLTGHWYKKAAGLLGTAGLAFVFLASYYTAYKYFFEAGKVDGVYQQIIGYKQLWLSFTDKLTIDLGVMLDPISVMMLVVVSTVSFMVHIYSLGYMKEEAGFYRFYAFLSLFTFAMMGLVVATNIFQMYIFWELVGVSSYLLIGFYYDRPSAVSASKKAFIVTRFADLGFLIGILILSYYTQTFDFQIITSQNGPAIAGAPAQTFMGFSILTWAMLLIFMGGAGKSAMFPLHIWLPDAMEGPTPVSALIHAATMVVAGVYLVARLFPIYSFAAPDALTFIGYLGAFTSLFAAIIAMTQFDIKRVLAFSTLSQIGYMMLALGVSGYGEHNGLGYTASMFHLFTHAMFKALLFLGAGAVIHAVHSNFTYEMGGLRKYLKITHITFLVAVLAIAGIPPFAGFWSKDEILVAAWEHNKLLFWVEYLVAGITAFYMSRLYFLIFWNKTPHYHHTPHEAPLVMTGPLMFLALMAIFAGLIPFSEFVSPDLTPYHTHLHYNIAIPSVLIALLGIGVAAAFYLKETTYPDKITAALKGLYKATYNKFYIDEVYMFVTHKIIFGLISKPIAWFDRQVIDGTMNLFGIGTLWASRKTKGLQSGQLQQYAFAFVAGAVILVLSFVYIWA